MKLEIKNLGRIQTANLDLGQIAIIAGKNDTGKSTISKLLFALLYGLSEEGRKKSLEILLKKSIDQLAFELYKITENSKFREYITGINRNEKNGDSIFDILEKLDLLIFEEGLDQLEEAKKIERLKKKDIFSREVFLESTVHFIHNEFYHEFNQLLVQNTFIKLSNEKTKEAYWGLYPNSQYGDISDKEFRMTPFRNAIYLESPFFPKENFELDHRTILNEKINEYNPSERNQKVINIIIEINSIIDGDFLNEDKNIFLKRGSLRIPEGNIATGIRSLGMIKLLLERGILKEDSYLILDEPEVHLHPEWQIKLAMIISKISKELNIRILINTHSPYFVEAMDVFKDYYNIDNVNYYLAKLEKEGAVFENVTDDISKIYVSLSESAYNLLDEFKEKFYFEDDNFKS